MENIIKNDLRNQEDISIKKQNEHVSNGDKLTLKNEITKEPYKMEIVWKNVFAFLVLHAILLHGLWLVFTFQFKWQTFVFNAIYIFLAGTGYGAGAHRYWTHHSFKATIPLQIWMMMCQSAVSQNSIYEWSRDHRVHHKFADTDADPHNARRGLFFSHIGWLMVKKHPDVKSKGKIVDLSDLEADPIVMFQKKFYLPLATLFTFIIPSYIPVYWWNEDWYTASILCTGRFVILMHATWTVNSFGHFFGYRPYDKEILPTENAIVSFLSFGEGWHNYHHIFPWDYKVAELGDWSLNLTKFFIDVMAMFGQAYELKTASPRLIKARILRTGDRERKDLEIAKKKDDKEDNNDVISDDGHLDDIIWGWNDKDRSKQLDNLIDLKYVSKND